MRQREFGSPRDAAASSSQPGTKEAPARYRHNFCCYRTKLLLCPSWIRTGIRNTQRETVQKTESRIGFALI